MNDPQLVARAEIVREKGTDRSRFFRGQVDKYTWQEVGSFVLPGELIAAFLWATRGSRSHYAIASGKLAALSRAARAAGSEGGTCAAQSRPPAAGRMCTSTTCCCCGIDRRQVLDEFARHDIWPVFHYVPLHSSPAGQRYGRTHGPLRVTVEQLARLIRLPLWVGSTEQQQERVVDTLRKVTAHVLRLQLA